ncbi:MAG: RluA family pseudouridine synthase [Oscillospiraceae bacterium]|nr:RluA family pseudouridine synthase [Oscillospiraceae bacterium]
MKELIFTNDTSGSMTLEKFLRSEKSVSKRLITKLKQQPMGITRDGLLIRTIDNVNPGDTIRLLIDDKDIQTANSSVYVPVAYENDSFVVFNKPRNMPVHPSIKHRDDTLGNYFSYLYPDCSFRPVNRLDRNTSGLCLAAKDPHTAAILQKSVEKTYYALVCGKVEKDGVIDAPIGRLKESIIKRGVCESGQRAVTHYSVVSVCDKYTFVRVKLETGRTHQIRVHFSWKGHPLAGDDMYGGSCEDITGQALHCGEMIINDSVAQKIIEVKAPLNEEMAGLMRKYSMKWNDIV